MITDLQRADMAFTSWQRNHSPEDLADVLRGILRHLRSHPAPTSSPSDENAGEANDEEPLPPSAFELKEIQYRGERSAKNYATRDDDGRMALYNAGMEAGKKHQASADAATIAAWRPVSERPESERYVLTIDERGRFRVARFDGARWNSGAFFLSERITHWQPLPEPPTPTTEKP